jgi:hypothetical protein
MARFYVDEREIDPPVDTSSLDQILKHVEATHISPKSLIRQVRVDGIPIVSDDLAKDFAEVMCQLESGDKVEIFTGTLDEIARDSIAEALTYLERIEAGIPSLATGFQVSPGPESFESLRQLYEGLYWLTLLLGKLETCFHITLDSMIIQGIPAQEHHQKFIGVLKQLIDSHQRGDLALISDMLEFEIIPLVPIWKEMFKIILTKVAVAQ